MKIRSLKNYKPFAGEINSQEVVTEPGLDVNIHDVIIAYAHGGQITNLNIKKPVYDPDEVVDDENVVASVFDGHDVDLTDVQNSTEYFAEQKNKFDYISGLAKSVVNGSISYDDFVNESYSVDADIAKMFSDKLSVFSKEEIKPSVKPSSQIADEPAK